MKSYCVKQKKFTNSLSGSEKTIRSKNGKLMLKSICAECGAKKSQFIKQPKGGSSQRLLAASAQLWRFF